MSRLKSVANLGYAWPVNGEELKFYGDALAEVITKLAKKYNAIEKSVLTELPIGHLSVFLKAMVFKNIFQESFK